MLGFGFVVAARRRWRDFGCSHNSSRPRMLSAWLHWNVAAPPARRDTSPAASLLRWLSHLVSLGSSPADQHISESTPRPPITPRRRRRKRRSQWSTARAGRGLISSKTTSSSSSSSSSSSPIGFHHAGRVLQNEAAHGRHGRAWLMLPASSFLIRRSLNPFLELNVLSRPQWPPATCYAPTGRPATCHALTGRPPPFTPPLAAPPPVTPPLAAPPHGIL